MLAERRRRAAAASYAVRLYAFPITRFGLQTVVGVCDERQYFLFGCFSKAEIGFSAIHVISCERGGVHALEKLNLKYHEPVVSERGLESGKVVFPHPNESLGGPEPLFQMLCFFEHRDDLIAIGKEIDAPGAQRFRVVEAQHLDIADDQTRA